MASARIDGVASPTPKLTRHCATPHAQARDRCQAGSAGKTLGSVAGPPGKFAGGNFFDFRAPRGPQPGIRNGPGTYSPGPGGRAAGGSGGRLGRAAGGGAKKGFGADREHPGISPHNFLSIDTEIRPLDGVPPFHETRCAQTRGTITARPPPSSSWPPPACGASRASRGGTGRPHLSIREDRHRPRTSRASRRDPRVPSCAFGS